MTETNNKKWVDAGIELAKDSKANVICPECNQEHLKTMDLFDESWKNLLERLIFCPACQAKNYIQYRLSAE
ncbi:MAG: hypothetical protein ACM3UZ_07515 [Acidobacteriota bacterium]